MKRAREKELKYLRENGKIDERAGVARIVAREFKSGDRPDLYAGTPRWKL